jgi:hypothetical protein
LNNHLLLFFLGLLVCTSQAQPPANQALSQDPHPQDTRIQFLTAFEGILSEGEGVLFAESSGENSMDFPVKAGACSDSLEIIRASLFKKEYRELLPGLNLESSLRWQSDDLAEENDPGYDERFVLGVSYDLLKSGYGESNWKENNRRRQWKLWQLQNRRNRSFERNFCDYQDYLDELGTQRLRLIDSQLQLMSRLDSLYRAWYFRGYLDSEIPMKVREEKQRIQHKLEYLSLYSPPQKTTRSYPFFSINLSLLKELMENDPRPVREQELLQNPREPLSKNLRLKFSAHNSLYRDTEGFQDIVSVGLSAQLPISYFGKKAPEDLWNPYIHRQKYQENLKKRLKEVQKLYLRIQNSGTEFLKENQVISMSRMQLNRTLARLYHHFTPSDFNELRLEVQDILRAQQRKSDHLLNMYESLADLIRVSELEENLSWITPGLPRQQSASCLRSGKRMLYIWSKDFAASSNEYLLTLMKVKSISTLIISPGDHGDLNQLARLARKVPVQYMLGINRWLNPTERADIPRVLETVRATGIKTLHLDVEPQALDAWHTQKDSLLISYKNMLQEVRKYWPDTLSVSIPAYFPESTLKTVYDLADEVIIMAYETKDPKVLRRRLKEETKMSSTKNILAVNAKEYLNEMELEFTLDRFSESLPFSTFAIHHLGSYQGMMKQELIDETE